MLLLSYGCIGTVYVLQLFLTVPWVRLRCVIVIFPDHTHLLFDLHKKVVNILAHRIRVSDILSW